MSLQLNFPVFFFSLAAGVIAAWIVFVIRKFVPTEALKAHHEVGFPIFLQIGVIYGVLLAFIFSMTWEKFSTIEENINLENSNLIAVFELSIAFPAEVQSNIRKNIIDYVEQVINFEWENMRSGTLNAQATHILNKLLESCARYNPKSVSEQLFYSQILSHLAQIREYRSMRVFQVHSPRIVRLITLITGLGIAVIAISFLFGMEVTWVQSILTGSLAATIAAIINMIIMFSHPFSGAVAIESTAFQDALHTIQEFNVSHPIPTSAS